MKKTFFSLLILLTGCALYREGFSPALKDIPKDSTQSIIFASDLSIPSQDNKAILLISHTPAIRILLHSGVMRYRQGHSIEIQRDERSTEIFQVEPTNSAVVDFSHPKKLLPLLQGSQQVQIELFVEGSGLQQFLFYLSPLVQ
jgi:hypothetical protein